MELRHLFSEVLPLPWFRSDCAPVNYNELHFFPDWEAQDYELFMRPSDTFFSPLRRWGMTQWLSIPMSRKSRYQMTPSAIVHCRKQDLSTRLEFIGVRGFSEPQKPSRKVKKMLLPEKCFRRHTGTISKLTFVEGGLKMVYVCALLRSFRNLQSEGKCIFSGPFFSWLCTQKIFTMYSPLPPFVFH